MNYEAFIASKAIVAPPAGFDPSPPVAPLFPFQRAIVDWAVVRGRAALFCDTGLGKTAMSLEWARQVCATTGGRVLILAPLAVAGQTVREGKKFGIPVGYARDASEVTEGISVTNYERLDRFADVPVAGVVLDESSILKAYSGITKRAILERFKATPYKLACTATPAPNDHLELGNHAEFLGVMQSNEMISRFFINDTSEFGSYRLKGHAITPFWDWVNSWACMVGLPSDFGAFDDAGYVLPTLTTENHVVDIDLNEAKDPGMLFRIPSMNATSVHREKRLSAVARAAVVAGLVHEEKHEPWIVWCDTDYEADALTEAIPTAVEVRGPDSLDKKESALGDFAAGKTRVLVTKPKIAGFGLNWQHCARVAFVGATFSFESYYQSIRRCWRFGQKRPVNVHTAMASTEKTIWDVLAAKRDGFEAMKKEMFAASRRARHTESARIGYRPGVEMQLPAWL